MRLTILCLTFCFSSTWPGTAGQSTLSFCQNVVDLSCSRYAPGAPLILIAKVEAPLGLERDILLQCNAHHECNVPITNGECIKISYYCIDDRSTFTIKQSSTIQFSTNATELRLMSDNYYSQSRYQEVLQIYCDIQFSSKSDFVLKSIHFNVYEFYPSHDDTEFCLSVKDALKPPLCRLGLRIFDEYDVSYTRAKENSWQFNLTLRNSQISRSTMRARFWIGINVSVIPNPMPMFHVTCNSEPGFSTTRAAETSTGGSTIAGRGGSSREGSSRGGSTKEGSSKGINILIPVIGVLSVLAVTFAGAFLWVIIKKRRRNRLQSQTAHIVSTSAIVGQPGVYLEDPVYYEICDANQSSRLDSDYLEPKGEAPKYLQIVPNNTEQGYQHMEPPSSTRESEYLPMGLTGSTENHEISQ